MVDLRCAGVIVCVCVCVTVWITVTVGRTLDDIEDFDAIKYTRLLIVNGLWNAFLYIRGHTLGAARSNG